MPAAGRGGAGDALPPQRPLHFRSLPPQASYRYLDGAGRSPLPDVSLAALRAALPDKAAAPHSVGSAEAALLSSVRRSFARVVGAPDASQVAVAPSTSYAISAAAQTLGPALLGPAAGVLVLRGQMASNVLPWQKACAERGARLVVVDGPDAASGGDWTPAVLNALARGGVGVAALPNFHWADGASVGLEAVAAACRARGVALVVDATQSAGACPLSVASLRPAFLCASVHKWLLGPYGFSLVYVDPAWCGDGAARPLEAFERNRAGAEAWDEAVPGVFGPGGYPTAYAPGARRFDGGGRPNPVTLPALARSLELVEGWGAARVAAYCAPLTARLAAGAVALGLDVPRSHAPHFVGLRWPAGAAEDGWPSPAEVRRRLRDDGGVYVSARGAGLRCSVHVYNDASDVDALLEALGKALRPRRPKL